MAIDIDQEVAVLRQLTVTQLRARHQELFGEPPRSTHKEQLIRRIAWRLLALAEGDLTERARRRATELARDADLRIRAPREASSRVRTSLPSDSPPTRDRRLRANEQSTTMRPLSELCNHRITWPPILETRPLARRLSKCSGSRSGSGSFGTRLRGTGRGRGRRGSRVCRSFVRPRRGAAF